MKTVTWEIAYYDTDENKVPFGPMKIAVHEGEIDDFIKEKNNNVQLVMGESKGRID